MRATVDRKVLAAMLDQAAKHVVPRTTIDILKTILLRAGGDRLETVATNLDVEFRGAVEAAVWVEGLVALDAGMLHAFVRQAPNGDVGIRADDGFVEVRAGRAWSRIPSLPPSDFPALFTGDQQPNVSFEIDAEALASARAATAYAVSSEKTRYYLNGTSWLVREGRIELCGTDGLILSLASLDLPDGAEGLPPVIVPEFPLPPLTGTVQIAVAPGFIRFAGDNWTITSKLIDARFPDYARLLPRAVATATVDRAEILAAVERCGAVADKAHRAVDLVHDEPGQLVVRALGAGDALVEDVVTIDGAQFVVCMSRAFLAETLSSFNSENIEIGLAEIGSAIRFTIPGETSRVSLIMPMSTTTPQRVGPPN